MDTTRELQRLQQKLRTPCDPHETARELGRQLRGLKADERREYLGLALELLCQQERAYGVALFLLEGTTDPVYLHELARHLLPLPASGSQEQESHLADLIRVLAAADLEPLIATVEAYLIEREFDSHWSTVPWALWPHRRDLFARAWLRFFQQHRPQTWEDTLVVKSFLTEPAAITLVKERLQGAAPARWRALRNALIRQAGSVSWLSAEQRGELDRTLQ